ncbi:hypothetical protein RG963_04045 [Methanosarcina sp. Z-7115]|uniref:Uncharacterized protein n=1 Tax=Methanosarcina baikalica TaxID=3073890 RepID=A0ABU2CZ07_9EURY|nr:hypothetical protein [Methanosarcina sp. Z-7115]MDR7664972.1 hypothetical protein [Methanosarcina sp. Z-7115]
MPPEFRFGSTKSFSLRSRGLIDGDSFSRSFERDWKEKKSEISSSTYLVPHLRCGFSARTEKEKSLEFPQEAKA